MPIYWDQFSWESFSSLATGVAAVGAAVWVGRRQLKIASRQTEILDRQATIAEKQTEIAGLAIRTELFDRRMAVFDATMAFLMSILGPAAPAEPHVETAFLQAKRSAKMLFSQGINNELQAVWADAVHFSAAHRQAKIKFEREGHYGSDGDVEHARLESLAARFDAMPELFSQEMGFDRAF